MVKKRGCSEQCGLTAIPWHCVNEPEGSTYVHKYLQYWSEVAHAQVFTVVKWGSTYSTQVITVLKWGSTLKTRYGTVRYWRKVVYTCVYSTEAREHTQIFPVMKGGSIYSTHVFTVWTPLVRQRYTYPARIRGGSGMSEVPGPPSH